MKRFKLVYVAIATLFAVTACSKTESLINSDNTAQLKSAAINGKYIVVLNNDATIVSDALEGRNEKVKAKALGLLKKYEITDPVEEVYSTALQGFTVKMAPGQAKKLEADGLIKRVEADKVISLSPITANGKPAPTPVAQSKPWGITRVNGGIDATGKVAWIIDSGIDLDHPDLNVGLSLSKTFLGSKTTADDQNGHGTHVAGTIAAKNNSIGVIGVAPNATVIAVRVLDRNGSGSTSGVIAGVDYVASKASANDVANMSLGGGVSTTLDEAVVNASTKCKFALAAGNESDDADNHSPARVNGNNIYTVSAMDSNNIFAYFSNYGSAVDYCEPGVKIYSTYKDGGYATLSGTSMAAPHLAGLLILGTVKTDGRVTGDTDGAPDPIGVH
jgi:subtilisin family serine protease